VADGKSRVSLFTKKDDLVLLVTKSRFCASGLEQEA
jgi:hypothetical protein